MKNISLWSDFKENQTTKKIEKNLEVDCLIIGGGMVGLSTLYHLKDSHLKTILVERNLCGQAVSARSTAKITFLQEDLLLKIKKQVGEKEATKYLQSQIQAMKELTDTIEKEKIDCDLIKVDSYLFTNNEKKKKDINELNQFLKQNKIETTMQDSIPFPVDCQSSLKVSNTYEFHVGKFLNSLKEKLKDKIYEYSKVEKITKKDGYYECFINNSTIKAKTVVIATHYPYFLIPFLFPFKNHIETSFIGAKKVKEFQNINAINLDKPTISLRYHKDKKENYLIYLFQSSSSCNIKDIISHFHELNKQYNFDYLWTNKDIITNDYLPFIGCIRKKDPTLLMGCGFNTWGMTNGWLSGSILKDIILNHKNPYISLFDPNRKLNKSKLIRLPKDIYNSGKAIIKSTKNNVNNKKVIYTKKEGKKVAIVIDKEGKEHIVLNKCPHMKCGLIFNEVEQTWDCLCHGSRFDIDGHCLEGPSNYDIVYKKSE